MLRKLAHFLGEVGRWRAQFDQVRDASSGAKADPIHEAGDLPQLAVLPKDLKMFSKD